MSEHDAPIARSLRGAGFRGRLRAEAPLAEHTTWRIGGPAELLARPADRDDVACALRWARATGTPWRVLGNGSNLLVRDTGVRGLVLELRKTLDAVRLEAGTARVGAGASFPALARQAAARGAAGLEFAGGIPGTMGGALVMNAGWHEHETRAVVCAVELVDADGEPRTLPAAECDFGYRDSAFRRLQAVLVAAHLELGEDAPERIRARMDAYAAARRRNQPTEQPSCGSVFLKPPGDFAGRLIEAAGLKGARAGDAQVSLKHANFIVNLGRARAGDVLALVARIEAGVEERFGVRLVREFELW